eukprot:gene1567-28168_t
MVSPVRGDKCRHIECFDRESYCLFGRMRCPICPAWTHPNRLESAEERRERRKAKKEKKAAEKRKDARDGAWKTKQEFKEAHGDAAFEAKWKAAERVRKKEATPPAKVADKTEPFGEQQQKPACPLCHARALGPLPARAIERHGGLPPPCGGGERHGGLAARATQSK